MTRWPIPTVRYDLRRDEAVSGGPADGELHIWEVDLLSPLTPDRRRLLSPEELTREGRFVFERDRHRFATARASLRDVLSKYVGRELPPDCFEYGPHGKPGLRSVRSAIPSASAVSAAAESQPIEFNLSHSGDRALIAVRRGGPVGVDLERHRTDIDWDGVGRLVFTPLECALLDALPAQEKRREFFRFWARKEAFLKCVGWGLGGRIEARAITVNPVPEAEGTLPGFSPAAPHLSLVDLAIAPDYSAAVATWHACQLVRVGPLTDALPGAPHDASTSTP